MERVKAVIFDWAGTVVDYGSLAPMGAFVETFAEFGVDDHRSRKRAARWAWPSGRISRRSWRCRASPKLGRSVTAMRRPRRTSTRVYAAFVPKNIAVAARYANLIPGAAEVVAELSAQGRQDRLVDRLHARDHGARSCRSRRRKGSRPTVSFAPATRPTDGRRPSCSTRRFLDLEVWPAWSVIKVDDTEVGIAEGINGGRLDRRRLRQRQLFRPVA